MTASGAAHGSYQAALAALDAALAFGIHPSLEPIRAMAEALGRPQDSFAAIQVTGTNGKSSVTRLTAALLEAHGVRTGVYTSPELLSETERIGSRGVPISEKLFGEAIAAAIDAAERADVVPTQFELLTAACLWVFRRCGVEAGVLEVGLGGRWDATSVVSPAVAVITGVGLDHTEYLGDTREAIAADKAHIIGDRSAVALGPGTAGVEAVFLDRAQAVGAPVPVRVVRTAGVATPVDEAATVRYRVTATPDAPDGMTRLDVHGLEATYADIGVTAPAYQAANVATAVAAAEAYLGRPLDSGAVRTAVASITFPGRFQVLRRDPWVIADGAHNPEAAAALATAIASAWPDVAARPTVVLGVFADKDATGIVSALASVATRFVCVASTSPRALSAADLATVVEQVTGTRPEIAPGVATGVELAVASNPAGVIVTGSIKTAAEAIAATTRTASPAPRCSDSIPHSD